MRVRVRVRVRVRLRVTVRVRVRVSVWAPHSSRSAWSTSVLPEPG